MECEMIGMEDERKRKKKKKETMQPLKYPFGVYVVCLPLSRIG